MIATFQFNEQKALAALAFVASEKPGLSAFFVSKVMFYAEKWHLNRFGRPILGDSYIKMENGPVPSTVKNYVDENWDRVEKPAHFDDALKIKRGLWVRWLYRGTGEANFDLLSETDKRCLREAIGFCSGKSKEVLSDLTHEEKAWKEAKPDRPMNYDFFVDDDNPNHAQIVSMMHEQAAYGVL